MPATSEPRTLEEMRSRVSLARARAERAAHARRLAKAREIARRSRVAWASLMRSDYGLFRRMQRLARLREAAEFKHIVNHPDGEAIVDLIVETARRHCVSVVTLMGPDRTAPVLAARWAAIAAVHEAFPHLSLPRLGHVFQRDHTTILNALRRLGLRPKPQQEASCVTPANIDSLPEQP
ncbi:helix-turn-helix domain-containing protein [Methylobacterium aquaticum]|uniref:helix-turn-helix domain-containing protein n=1 Tax=Methylobacterium aquaticum TaxID=270351 RepID=UPI001933D3B8|nr:helix-turn-helix domain-containing protein [Methylobacterium aquaticum]QRE76508.1 hypothetical protein F1D61_25665 [Methylobacterium aquaticum]